jgi:hypothetical protein
MSLGKKGWEMILVPCHVSFPRRVTEALRKCSVSVTVVLATLWSSQGTLLAQQPPRIAAPQPSPSVDPQDLPSARDGTLLVPVFSLQHSHYAAGDPIFVRLGFRNISGHVVNVRSGAPPWSESKLTIIGPDGRPVPQGLLEIGGDDGSGRFFSINPGATQFLMGNGQEWYSLDHWSYHLTSPGRYRLIIRALPSGTTTHVGAEQATTVTLTIDS